jgi:hypothetical protein
MNPNAVERHVQRTAARWAFVQQVETVDKTDDAIKLRLLIDTDCFVQVYVNTRKQIISYVVVINRARILGRDCDGGSWHWHPPARPDQHDFSPEGQRAVSLDEFLKETQQVLQDQGLL